ncbi:MAG: hypothetical protein LBU65_11885, partial [Planctomycetaceae bacterium]|nr:hypothetical protein [Planctomycetaceae bacterium]
MSTEQQSESSIDNARQQIRNTLTELMQTARLDTPPEVFHADFLQRVVVAMSAMAGAVWSFDPQKGLSLSCQINMQSIELQNNEDGNRQHSRLLYRMLESSENGTLVLPHSTFTGGEQDSEAGNPTDHILLFCPVRTELETTGLVEIILRANTPPNSQQGCLRFVTQATLAVVDYHKNRQLRHFNDRQSLWSLLEEFTRSIHRSLDVRQTSYTIVNEARRLVECDRVTIALLHGRQCRAEAISGQDTIDKRATAVRQLNKLATAVVR